MVVIKLFFGFRNIRLTVCVNIPRHIKHCVEICSDNSRLLRAGRKVHQLFALFYQLFLGILVKTAFFDPVHIFKCFRLRIVNFTKLTGNSPHLFTQVKITLVFIESFSYLIVYILFKTYNVNLFCKELHKQLRTFTQ